MHHGLGIGAHLEAANNVVLVNNTFFNFVKYGINIQSSNNITIDGNIVADINSRNLGSSDSLIDVTAGILGCALYEGDMC